MKNEIVIYQFKGLETRIEVKVQNENVWLNRNQLSVLFGRDIKTIGKHISNAKKEELLNVAVVANFATTATDGKIYQVEHYNLDMIISIGYRVKSNRGVQFRIWANQILKDYLLKGYSLNNRMNRLEDHVENLARKVDEIDLQISTNLPPKQGVFFDGQVFDAYAFVNRIIKRASSSIILIDNYIDDSVLTMLSKTQPTVKIQIYTKSINKKLQLDVQKFKQQYPNFQIKLLKFSHDRFLIIDRKELYHIGASLKDLGKKWFAFSKMDTIINDILNKLP